MTYAAQDYSSLFTMKDFSETLLQNHFTLYQGYATNTNKLLVSLDTMLKEGNIFRL
jgi:Fe-Mn family superoxide dismutase